MEINIVKSAVQDQIIYGNNMLLFVTKIMNILNIYDKHYLEKEKKALHLLGINTSKIFNENKELNVFGERFATIKKG